MNAPKHFSKDVMRAHRYPLSLRLIVRCEHDLDRKPVSTRIKSGAGFFGIML